MIYAVCITHCSKGGTSLSTFSNDVLVLCVVSNCRPVVLVVCLWMPALLIYPFYADINRSRPFVLLSYSMAFCF